MMDNVINDLQKIYESHKREETDARSIEFKRFLIDGKPTCMAWYGLGAGPRMACRLLAVSRMGTKYSCLWSGDNILGDIMEPTENCPLWP